MSSTTRDAIYPEIAIRRLEYSGGPPLSEEALSKRPEFPDECPACGAPVEEEGGSGKRSDGPVYECGGQYTTKPQIQSHTDKWWGKCPEVADD